jgi:cob(I)alamin adenosyltransferase
MVRLTRIYTRGGDKGETSLGNGQRTPKHHRRVAAYGEVDETNAVLGLVRLHADASLDALLSRLQNDLFDLGADLCTPHEEAPARPPLRVSAAQVSFLEQEIDRANAKLQPLTSFVLPAGTPAAAHLHHARTVARRAERALTALGEREEINPQAVCYLNRLSDLLFVLARAANEGDEADVLWVPGAHRE